MGPYVLFKLANFFELKEFHSIFICTLYLKKNSELNQKIRLYLLQLIWNEEAIYQ